jgi:hypothetical protein
LTEVEPGPGGGENRAGRLGLEPGGELPREDAVGVVDHGVQVKSSSVEQPDDGQSMFQYSLGLVARIPSFGVG